MSAPQGFTNLLVPNDIAKRLISGRLQFQMALDSGDANVCFPSHLTQSEYEFLEEWFRLILNVAKRTVTAPLPSSPAASDKE